jgi:hypothetical protein
VTPWGRQFHKETNYHSFPAKTRLAVATTIFSHPPLSTDVLVLRK